jgi:L-ribulose-5-phosphate 4-epimerase
MTHEHENTNSPAVADIRELVALSSRILGHTDQGDLVWGHASARDPHGRGVWMKASGWGLEEITPERVQLVSPSGEVLQGTGGRHSEYPIHTEIMTARADVGGVVHTHSPYAVALAAAGQPLLPVSHAATYFVPPEVPRFTDTADLILTSDLGKRVAASLGSASAVFLVNHGIVTAGPTLQVATVAAVLLERAAHQQWITHGFRSWPTWSDAPEALSKRDHIYHPQALDQVWNYLVRRLERLSHPGEAAGGEPGPATRTRRSRSPAWATPGRPGRVPGT